MVGLGWAATRIWLPRLNGHPDFVVSAVVDPDEAARASAVGSEGGVLMLSSVDQLSSSMVELAIIAVPNHLHAAVASTLLAAGIPAFVEKPVCLNSSEVDQLAAAERAGGAVLLAGSAARYRADVRSLQSLVGAVGQVRHVDLAWVRARGVPNADGWFTRRRLAGGGALIDLGWHLLDTAATVLGPVTCEQVVGAVSGDFVNSSSSHATWRQDKKADGHAGGQADVEDSARCFLVTADGVSVSLHASWASHEARDLTRIRVEGSAGTITLRCTFGFSPNRQHRSTLTHTRDGTSRVVQLPDEPVGVEYARQLDEVPALLNDPASKGRAIEEASRIVGVIEQVYDSARLGQTSQQPILYALAGDVSKPATAASQECGFNTTRAGEPGSVAGAPDYPTRAVIFDLDGVIVDSSAVMREAFAIAYAEVVGDGDPPFEEYCQHLGRYFPDIMQIMGLPLEMEQPFVRESYRLAHRILLFDGIADVIRELRARGIRLAVATGKSGARARSLLDQLGILKTFDHVIGSDEVDHPKPAPDIVLRALELLGVRSQEAVMVGDAVTDLASAQAAAVAAAAALWGESNETEMLRARPDAVLRRPSDLLALCPAVTAG